MPTSEKTPSPFLVHREKVLGKYGTAAWLRSVIMAMWDGSDGRVSLTRLPTLDHQHFAAFMEMLEAYYAGGANDPAFLTLAREVSIRCER